MGIEIMALAALFIATSNYCMRKSIDAGGSSNAFLMIQLSIIFLVAILLNPVRTGNYAWSPEMGALGVAGGLVLGIMVLFLGKALERGPPGLTFAAINSSTVMPMVLMSLVFGPSFGYVYQWSHAIGSIIVIFGLLWAAKGAMLTEKKRQWLALVIGAFLLHTLFLAFMQWRALFINFPGEDGLFLSFDVDSARSQWFMPCIFFVAALMQVIFFLRTERRKPKSREIFYGIMGGAINGVGTFFMILATELSVPWEHAMIFPIFAVIVIICCNAWGQWIYKEKVNWWANGCCMVGILIGTLDWQTLLTYK